MDDDLQSTWNLGVFLKQRKVPRRGCPWVLNFVILIFWGKNDKCVELPEMARKFIRIFVKFLPSPPDTCHWCQRNF